MELSLLLPEIKQGRDWGHCFGVMGSPLCSKCLSHEGTHTAPTTTSLQAEGGGSQA